MLNEPARQNIHYLPTVLMFCSQIRHIMMPYRIRTFQTFSMFYSAAVSLAFMTNFFLKTKVLNLQKSLLIVRMN